MMIQNQLKKTFSTYVIGILIACGFLMFTANALATSSPTISVISPASGTSLGNTSVTIAGTGFVAGADVKINGISATNVNVLNSTSITANVPVANIGSAAYGATWTPNSGAGSRSWTSVVLSSTGQYQTAGTDGGYIYTSSDYGVTWMPNTGAGIKTWYVISMSSNGQYQTAGDDNNGYIYTSSDYGATWTPRTSSGLGRWFSGSCSSNGQYQVAVNFTNTLGYFSTSSDYGVTWTQRTSAGLGKWISASLSSSGQYQSAATDDTGNIYVSSDYGATWTKKIIPGGHDYWNVVSLSKSGQYQTAVDEINGYVYTSSDYGVNWMAMLGSGLNNWGYANISGSGQYQAAIGENDNYIHVSSDFGVTWTAVHVPHYLYRVSLSSNGKYQSAVGFGDYIYTSSAGAVDVVITNPDNGAATLTKGFTYIDAPLTATSNGIFSSIGATTITLGQAITGLAASDIVVKRDRTILTKDIDYTLSADLSGTSFGITFLASAGLINTSVVTVEMSSNGYLINSGNPIEVVNAIPSTDATISSGTLAQQSLVGTFAGGSTIANSSSLTITLPSSGSNIYSLRLFTGNANSTVKYFKGSQPSSDADYASTYSRPNTSLSVTNGGIIWLLVTAQDGTTKLYYKITVTLTPNANASISSASLAGRAVSGSFTGGANIANSAPLTVAILASERTSAVLNLVRGDSNSIVKYFIGSQPVNDAGYTSTYSAGSTTITVANGSVIWLLVTAEDTTTKLYYKITVSVVQSAYTVELDFTGSSGNHPGSTPIGSLVRATDGYFYGMTSSGGTNNAGVIFKWDGSNYTVLHNFSSGTGSTPNGSLIQAVDGYFYGMTSSGGTNNAGVIFKWDGSNYTVLHNFSLETGYHPYGSLIQAIDGNFYGMTSGGGANDSGVIFEWDGNNYSDIYDFGSVSSLIQTANGNFYGLANGGGISGNGAIFRWDGSDYYDLYDFGDGSSNVNGSTPIGSLVRATDGYFYGMTSSGGTNNAGVIFKWDGSNYTVLHNFSSGTGSTPNGSLIQAVDGYFYGMTSSGGTNNAGVIFKWDGSNYTNIYDFGSGTGSHPYGSLIQSTDGNFYGMTSAGGANNFGNIFKLSTLIAPPIFSSATTNTAGTVATIAFTKTIANPSGSQSDFDVEVDGSQVAVSSVALNADLTKIDLTLATPVLYGQTVTIRYNGIDISSADNGILASFGPETVTNLVPISTDATLSNLTISSGTLSPTFASGTTSYTASVINGTEIIAVTPTLNQANATVKVNGTTVASGSASSAILLNVGSNTITILVTAQDTTTTKTYTITVTRAGGGGGVYFSPVITPIITPPATIESLKAQILQLQTLIQQLLAQKNTDTTAIYLTKDLKYRDADSEVVLLKNILKKLNLFPKTVSSNTIFGSLTLKAVRDFQIKYNILKASSSQYGGVGQYTRNKLNQLNQ